MSELIFRKVVDQSLLKSGITIPKNIQTKLLENLGITLAKGQKNTIRVLVNGDRYEVALTNVNFSEKYASREIVQIRYAEGSTLCHKLNEIFAHSSAWLTTLTSETSDQTITVPADEREYVDIYSAGPSSLEFKCIPISKVNQLYKYIGDEKSLAGYQRSYKLVFYKCFFELLGDGQDVAAKKLSQEFKSYYVSRKIAGLIPDTDADQVINNIEESSIDSVYRLILRNPFAAINGKGYVAKVDRNGETFFVLDSQLRRELGAEDIKAVLDLIDKKLSFYYSKIDGVPVGDGQMREVFERILNEYVSAKAEPFAGHSMGAFFRDDIPQAIYKTGIINSKTHLITGSVGQGNWATVPWVCIFDRSLTTTATRGVYIVYLLAKDGNTLYLTFNQGCTDIRNSHSKAETIKIMRQKAAEIVARIDSRGFASDENINLGTGLTELALLYQRGTIFYKAYQKENLPSENILRDDLANMMRLYVDYAGTPSEVEPELKRAWLLTWNPNNWEWVSFTTAVDATHSGQSFADKWSCVNTHVQVGDRIFLAMVGTENNGIIASGYATSESYEAEHWDVTKAAMGQTSRRISVDFDWITDYKKEPILSQKMLLEQFPQQIWNPQGSGIAVKQDYIDELEVLWLSIRSGGEEELSVKEIIANIKNYIAIKGFSYEEGLIENFYLSLKSKPFVLLAGTSGTGKTRLAKLFAEAIGATTMNGRYKMVSVRSDWSDSSDLFGHIDLNGKFIPGTIIDFVKQAEIDISRPYFLCLDEMNLARVEYYFSDVLSIIETREFHESRIETDPLISNTFYGTDQVAFGRYGTVRLPENLYIIGTVNMDETTFPFSRKVLDRANTIEFSYVDLIPTNTSHDALVQPQNLPNSFLRTEYLLLVQCAGKDEAVGEYCAELQSADRILQKANAHVGYRVRDEIVFYLLNNKNADLLPVNEAMDNAIMQKILPRIQGSSSSVKVMLCDLFKHCAGDYSGYQTNDNDISAMMFRAAESSDCKYRKSANKIAFMVRRYEEDGFTSYWL